MTYNVFSGTLNLTQSINDWLRECGCLCGSVNCEVWLWHMLIALHQVVHVIPRDNAQGNLCIKHDFCDCEHSVVQGPTKVLIRRRATFTAALW